MTYAVTLSAYVARQFTGAVLIMVAALTGLVSLFDLIELLRRAATKQDAGFALVIGIEAMRMPSFAMQILPFGVLLGGILAFWRLTRSSELIVARAAGISAWQFLAAPLACALLLGTLATTIVSPLSSALLARADLLDNLYLRTGSGPLDLANGQLWLRQSDRGLERAGVAILHGYSVTLQGGALVAHNVSVFRLGPADQLLERVDAGTATLEPHEWVLRDAHVMRPDAMPGPAVVLRLPTDLTVGRVQESFAAPGTLSFWRLPGFIRLLNRSGFSSIRHELQYQSLLALPLLAGTMALVAAGFSMRPARRGGVARMIGSGLSAGFALFALSKIADQFGEGGALPPVLAAWAPAAAGLLLALAMLLHLEDG